MIRSENLSSRSKLIFVLSFVFILIALPLLVFLASNKNSSDNRSRANLSSDAEMLTKDLLDPTKDDSTKINVASQRKIIMENLAKEDPELFLLNVIPEEIKTQLPVSTRELIEKQIEIEGDLTQNISEEDTENDNNFIIQELDTEGFVKNAYIIIPREGQDLSPTKVKIRGYLINNILVPNSIDSASTNSSSVILANNSILTKSVLGISTSGNKKVAVLMVNFKSDKSDTARQFTKEELEKIYFKGTNSATNYINTASNNQIKLTGDISDIYGWITLPNYTRKQACDINETSSSKGYIKAAIDKAKVLAQAQGKNFDDYQIIGFVFPYADIDCNWGSAIAKGVGNVDSNAKPYHFLNGDYCRHSANCTTKDLKFYGALMAHEISHNLGLSHANGLSCGSKNVDKYANCKSITYADRFDIIGGDWTYFPQVSASNQVKYLKWIPAENQKNVNPSNINEDGTYTLYSVSKPRSPGQLQFLRIPRPVEGGAYYLESRSKNGLDANLPSNLFGGALIRLSEVPDGKLKDESGNLQYRSEQTYLINPNRTGMTNWTQFLSPALSDGKTFTDSTNGIKITQISHDSIEGKATLKIEFLPTACTSQNPLLVFDELVKSGTAGSGTQYNFKLKNTNSLICKPVTFNLSAQAPTNWLTQLSSKSVTLNSGQSINLTVNITAPQSAQINNPFKIYIKAQNSNKTAFQATKEIRFNILPSVDPAGNTTTRTPSPTNKPSPTPVRSVSPSKSPSQFPSKSPTPTPSRTPTSQPLPTIAIDPQSTYLRAVIGLQGIGQTGTNSLPNLISGNSNPNKKNIDVKIKIVSTDTTSQELSGKAQYDNSLGKYVGTFKLTKQPTSEINNLFISTPGYLPQRVDAQILPKTTNTVSLNVSGGDIDENNERNLIDWNMLNACSIFKFQNKQLCPDNSRAKTNADMNSDGIVDQSDITLFYQELFGSRRN